MRLTLAYAALVAVAGIGCDRSGPASDGERGDEACAGADGLIGSEAEVAADGQFPAVAGLLVQTPADAAPDHLTCTMTKIGERSFVLAAHCMFPFGEQDGTAELREEVRPGVEIGVLHGVLQPGQKLDGHAESTLTVAHVREVRVHPSWLEAVSGSEKPEPEGKFTFTDGDAAILVVDELTPHIATARISADPVAPCTEVVMNGYGCRTFSPSASTDRLRFLPAQVETILGSMLVISSGFTGSPKDGSICPGDSGGALFSAEDGGNSIIVGLNSRFVSGQLLGAQINPNQSYFTRLDDAGPHEMATWLREQMDEIAAPGAGAGSP